MPDGGAVISGTSADLPNSNIITIRYAPDGTKLWQRLENAGYVVGVGGGGLQTVAVDAQGQVYTTGYGYDISFREDIVTLGYSPDGDLLWTEIYANPEPAGTDVPHAIAVDGSGNVFVAAHSWESATSNDFTTIRYTQKSLGANVPTLSVGAGGTVELTIDAGPTHASRGYFLLGTLSGTSPGFPLPGGTILPLNWDPLTRQFYRLANSAYLVNFQGTLNGEGMAEAQMNTFGPLPPSLVGMKMHLAFTLLSPFDFVSNAVEVDLVN